MTLAFAVLSLIKVDPSSWESLAVMGASFLVLLPLAASRQR